MNTNVRVVINLLNLVLTNRLIKPSQLENVDWKDVYEFSVLQGISCMVARGIEICGCDIPLEIKRKFDDIQIANVFREAKQDCMAQNIFMELEKDGIEFLPLKGIIMKYYYPSVELREMCDIDILIHDKDIDKVYCVMEKCDFVFVNESAHEYIFKSDIVTVEIHKTIVPNYNHDLYKYYGNGWQFAVKKNNSDYQYELSQKDFFVYNIAHTAKHYLNGGIGIKQIIDIFILININKFSNNDLDYITRELDKLNLKEFYDSLLELIDAWFCDKAYTRRALFLEKYTINGGVFGDAETAKQSKIYRYSADGKYLSGRLKYIKDILLPSVEQLSIRYNVLKKTKMLYPLLLLYRVIDAIIHRRRNIIFNLKKSTVKNNQVNEFAEFCDIVGIKKSL